MTSGGGGTSTTEQHAEYPAEFRPLATSAVSQIQALQNALPLSGFAGSLPISVPGTAPFTEAGFQLAALSPLLSSYAQALGQFGAPLSQIANRAVDVSAPNAAGQRAIAGLFQQPYAQAGQMSAPGGVDAQVAALRSRQLALAAQNIANPSSVPGYNEIGAQLAALHAGNGVSPSAMPWITPPAAPFAPLNLSIPTASGASAFQGFSPETAYGWAQTLPTSKVPMVSAPSLVPTLGTLPAAAPVANVGGAAAPITLASQIPPGVNAPPMMPGFAPVVGMPWLVQSTVPGAPDTYYQNPDPMYYDPSTSSTGF